MRPSKFWTREIGSFRLGRLTEPWILFPGFGVLLLGLVWGATFNLLTTEYEFAARAAAASSLELAETYEAQVVRALREIDQTSKVVKYAYEVARGKLAVSALKERSLLPPDLLFVVAIADANGDIVASNRPPLSTNVAGRDYFESAREIDALAIGRPERDPNSQEWTLHFGRRLDAQDGSFAGAVVISVGAAYFVSGYEESKLGAHGVLAILGTDGVFRARRTGERVTAGLRVDYEASIRTEDGDELHGTLSTNPWDDVRRYTSAIQLYDFPLAVIVGLAQTEALASAHIQKRWQLWTAAGASAAVILVLALLGRSSVQLARVRRSESDARLAYAARVEYLAYHDALTGLPNRSLFTKLLEQGIVQARRHERAMALLFLDLDRFKHINDTLGHEAGDQLLQEVARRLTGCLRDSDTVARLGGDEFVVLLLEIRDPRYVAAVARKMLAAIAEPFVLRAHDFRVTVSIGIALFPQDGSDEQTLTKNADIAMYQAKVEGKNNFRFYSEKANANSLERLTLESCLRDALERGEFRNYYQAKRDVTTGRISGMEALLRWQHPNLGIVAPMEFIPIAIETGLILPIGRWVLRDVCRQNVAWQAQGLPRVSVAVNLTTRQFTDEYLLRDVATALEESGLDPALLELEVSEASLIHDVEKAVLILGSLREMGVRLAIDDFGVGYASLAYIQHFPIDTIKIDRSFVRNIVSGHSDRRLADLIVATAKTLSLTVVAQGVETKEQADYLRGRACDEFQGFYFDQPVTAEQFGEQLRAQPPAAPAQVDAA